ncbi:MAG: hypothetical protein WCB52_03500, partial [Pseudolabrys sp.]
NKEARAAKKRPKKPSNNACRSGLSRLCNGWFIFRFNAFVPRLNGTRKIPKRKVLKVWFGFLLHQ